MNLEDQIEQLTVEINRLWAERDKLVQQLLESNSPYKVGDIITWGNNRKGRVIFIHGTPPYLRWGVVRIKNDGTKGTRCIVRYYDKPRKVNE